MALQAGLTRGPEPRQARRPVLPSNLFGAIDTAGIWGGGNGQRRPPPPFAFSLRGFLLVNGRIAKFGLEQQGIVTPAQLHWNLTTAPLVEFAVQRNEGLLAKDGPLAVKTGRHTGRSAQDKFTVSDELTEKTIWWNKGNKPM